MTQGDVETYFSSGVWRNRVVGRGDLPGTHPTRQQATRIGGDVAHVLHVHHVISYCGRTPGRARGPAAPT